MLPRRSFLLLPAAALALGGCAVLGNVAQLDDGYYRVVHRPAADTLAALGGRQPLYVQQRADTLLLTPDAPAGPPRTTRYALRPDQRLWLLRRRLDLDVFTIPFKVRPPRGGVPVQLNTNFNAALYVGRRLDFYSLRTKRTTPFGATPHIRATGLGYGAFIGAGSTFITDDVTAAPPPPTTKAWCCTAAWPPFTTPGPSTSASPPASTSSSAPTAHTGCTSTSPGSASSLASI